MTRKIMKIMQMISHQMVFTLNIIII